MISNPDLVLYACVAKGPTILTEFCSDKEPGIEAIAQLCIEKTPPHHSTFSHTIRNKTYTFLINDPFAYFLIFDEDLPKSESFWFLERLKIAFEDLISSSSIRDFDKLTNLCFQGKFYPCFREILFLDVGSVDSKEIIRNQSMDSTRGGDSTRGKRMAVRPLLLKPSNMMKKKKRPLGCWGDGDGGGEANGDHHNNNYKEGGGLAILSNKVNHVCENGSRDFSVPMAHKNNGGSGSGFYFGDGKQKAKQIWRKHVWVVLGLDLVICAVLFGIWLWVCRGFKCIDG